MAGYTWEGKKPGRKNPALEAHERGVLDAPDHYVATIFRGIGKLERRNCATIELARTAAKELIGTGNRPAIIYAVKGTRDQVAETVYPQK